MADVAETEDGLRVIIRHSKTEQEEQVGTIAIAKRKLPVRSKRTIPKLLSLGSHLKTGSPLLKIFVRPDGGPLETTPGGYALGPEVPARRYETHSETPAPRVSRTAWHDRSITSQLNVWSGSLLHSLARPSKTQQLLDRWLREAHSADSCC